MENRDPMIEEIDYEIVVSADRRTVWVNGADGTCIGRFSLRFGLDVHKPTVEQMAGAGQCLHCTHEPAGPAEWKVFREQMQLHHRIDVPIDLVKWPSGPAR